MTTGKETRKHDEVTNADSTATGRFWAVLKVAGDMGWPSSKRIFPKVPVNQGRLIVFRKTKPGLNIIPRRKLTDAPFFLFVIFVVWLPNKPRHVGYSTLRQHRLIEISDSMIRTK